LEFVEQEVEKVGEEDDNGDEEMYSVARILEDLGKVLDGLKSAGSFAHHEM
jgi:hypothetical protein